MLRKNWVASLFLMAFSGVLIAGMPSTKDLKSLTWKKSPHSDAEYAVIKGDPEKKGYFVTWVKIPPNYRSKPHHHDGSIDSIVVSGKARVTFIDKSGHRKVVMIKKDQFISVPPHLTHIVETGKKGLIVQNTGFGPMRAIYEKS